MEITTTFATCAVQLRRLAMPSAAAFGGTRGWLDAPRNAKHNVPGVPVWSPPHC
ncbi:hypothetical protein GCM10011584_03410 [Nocardioides phosphati]|uniref:Uncharacterized protein n=1 Tax=Nocardioides phosphati TaxID=1867775 RepID=A0ABQ2N6E0_9ACTN|nr:hypothetical protein [Nocardioides phosphati]GGO84850.1 hypothetical protein GCM10011584_03410 [Nocardioides phosphati]